VPKQPRICLVSPSHVAANPRLVKEANALHAAGYAVHVVAGWYYPTLDVQDHAIYSRAPWDRTVVYYFTGPRVLLAKLRRNLARKRLARGGTPSLSLASRGIHAATYLLARAAAKTCSDLYIGHCAPGLAAAALAARKTGSRYGFDAEDFHCAETDYVISDPALQAATKTIEQLLLPRCTHVTAASPLIAEAYSETYNIPLPTTVLNTFPLSEAPTAPVPRSDVGSVAKLYWFSQTIGPGRGLEQLVGALASMRNRCELHLRGIPAIGFMDHLGQVASDAGYSGKIEVHSPAPASEMSRLAAAYDLGLALEQNTPLNRDLCLTNKIFTYLLAGIPVALTPTRAQRQIAEELGNAALLIDLEDPSAVAATLDAYLEDPIRRSAARAEAWRLAQTRYNWDIEQARLISAVEQVLPRPIEPIASASA
jgi:glycosyltransferase involved in cell wall biosynthesis